jgi:hypothetical protein
MKRMDQPARIVLGLSFVVLVLTSHPTSATVSALTEVRDGTSLPVLADFVEQVWDGEANVLRGVYVPEVMALPVMQQPNDKPGYVSRKNGEVTQFSAASDLGNIGLLAHNNLSGRYFSQLEVGTEVHLVFGNGRVDDFVVTEVLRFQALQPGSFWSYFLDMANDQILSAGQVFDRVYNGDYHVTFQTCIAANGNLNWGRMFVIAMPLP